MKELTVNDSLIIDYLPRQKVERPWQAHLRVKADSCYVSMYPAQGVQDTMLPASVVPLSYFATTKRALVAGLEEEKNALKLAASGATNIVDIFLSYGDMLKFLDGNKEAYKTKEFTLTKIDGLYRRLRNLKH